MVEKVKKCSEVSTFLIILILSAVLVSCTTTPPTFSEGPPLVAPVATQMDTFVVERGIVEQKQLLTGILRINSTPLSFGLYHAFVGDVFVEPGNNVVTGQLLARLNVDLLEDQIAGQTDTVSHLRRLHNLELKQGTLVIDLMIIAYNAAVQNAAATLDPQYLEQAESLRKSIEWESLLHQQATQISAAALSDAEHRLNLLLDGLVGSYIIAPFDGVITNVLASEGIWVRRDQHIIYIAEAGQNVFVELVNRGGHITPMVLEEIARAGQNDFAELLGRGKHIAPRTVREAVRTHAFIGGQIFDLELMQLTDQEQAHYSQLSLNAVGAVFLPIRFNILAPAEKLPQLGESVTVMLYNIWYEDVLRVPLNSFYLERAFELSHFMNMGQIFEIGSHWGPYILRVDGDALEMVPVTAHATDTFVAILDGLQEGDVVFVRP